MQYEIDPQDCLLLYAIYQAGSIKAASHILKKDPSVVLKRVQKISRDTVFIEKMNGLWTLTEKGKQIALWAKEMQLSQKAVLKAPTALRLGATMFFVERVIAPQLARSPLKELSLNHNLEILCPSDGLEAAILRGSIDIAFACGRPNDPLVGFKKVCDERWSIVCSPKLAQKVQGKTTESKMDKLLVLPFLRHKSLVPEEMLKIDRNKINTLISFDTVVGLRSGAINGLGWTLLPRAAVWDEIESGKLIDLSATLQMNLKNDFLGIWWLKENKSIKPHISPLLNWLSTSGYEFKDPFLQDN